MEIHIRSTAGRSSGPHALSSADQNGEPIAGDMHFDASEAERGTSTDLFSVALHETGMRWGWDTRATRER